VVSIDKRFCGSYLRGNHLSWSQATKVNVKAVKKAEGQKEKAKGQK
jgi:hypothetical protein